MLSLVRFSNTPAPRVNSEKSRRVQFTKGTSASTPTFTTGKKALNSLTKSTIRSRNTTKRKFGFLETNSTFKPHAKRIRSEGTARKPAKLQLMFERELNEQELQISNKDERECIEKRKVELFDPDFDENDESIFMEAVVDRRMWDIKGSPVDLPRMSELDSARPHIPNVFGNASPPSTMKTPGSELDMSLESLPTTSRSPTPGVTDSVFSDCQFFNGESYHMGSMSPFFSSDASDELDESGSDSSLSMVSCWSNSDSDSDSYDNTDLSLPVQ